MRQRLSVGVETMFSGYFTEDCHGNEKLARPFRDRVTRRSIKKNIRTNY